MILRYVVVGLAAGALLGALAVYLALRWYRERTGFAAGGTGRVVASDTGVEASILLRDPQLGLRGRPDYLLEFEVAGHPLFVPLELKPGRRTRRVYESDALQVAAYLIALRATAKDAAACPEDDSWRSRTMLDETQCCTSKLISDRRLA